MKKEKLGMVEKEFITQEMIRDASLKLCHRMYKEDGFFPDIIYDSLRGGAYMANVMSEYYKIVAKNAGKKPVLYAAVVARSYGSVKEHSSHVDIDGWTVKPEDLPKDSKVLIVDDIFDTGMTVNALVGKMLDAGLIRENIKVAVYDYKVHVYDDNALSVHPDYFARKHIIERPEDSKWIHYTMHEFLGLTSSEIDQLYDDEEVKHILKEILSL